MNDARPTTDPRPADRIPGDAPVASSWEGAPAFFYSGSWGLVVSLPEGHDGLGYAPGSQFYVSDGDEFVIAPS